MHLNNVPLPPLDQPEERNVQDAGLPAWTPSASADRLEARTSGTALAIVPTFKMHHNADTWNQSLVDLMEPEHVEAINRTNMMHYFGSCLFSGKVEMVKLSLAAVLMAWQSPINAGFHLITATSGFALQCH